MSSILEALKKLEAEKAEKQAQQRSAAAHSRTAAGEFLSTTGDASGEGPRFPWGAVLAVVASGLAVVVVGTSVITASLLSPATEQAPSTPSTQIATAQPVPVQSVPVQATQLLATPAAVSAAPPTAAPLEPAPAVAPVPAAPAAPPPAPETPAAAAPKAEAPEKPAPAPATPKPEKPAPEKAPEPEPEVEPARLAKAATEEPAPVPVPVPKPAPAATPYKPEIINVSSLPPLRNVDREKYGLDGVKVNLLRGVSETRPYGQAIINLDKVMIGEVIPDTKVMLVAIDERRASIGIEILDTGERFSFP